MNTEQIGWANVEIGAGRKTKSDPIDMTAGLEFLVQPGDFVEKGQLLFRIFGKNRARLKETRKMLLSAIILDDSSPPSNLPLVAEVLT